MMTFSDLSVFCRLCLMPLNGSYIDCALDENQEFNDTIKMVYNIDINVGHEYSTNVCLMCCDVLMYNTIHYVRAIEAQKSLTRVQRIKNKLRIFGKKKIAEKKIEKEPLPDSPVIVDIEMADVEPIGSKVLPMDCEIESVELVNSLVIGPPMYTETNPPMFFANLSSFNQTQCPTIQRQTVNCTHLNCQNAYDRVENVIDVKESLSPVKIPLDQNNNVKQSPSLFQMAKNFCGNMMKKHKPSMDAGLDEITNQMASLRFTA